MQWRLQGKNRAAEDLCRQLDLSAVFSNGKTSNAYNLISKALRDEVTAAIRSKDLRIQTLEIAIRMHRRAACNRGEEFDLPNALLYRALEDV